MSKIKDLKDEVWKLIKLPHPHKSRRYYVSSRARFKSVDKKTKSEQIIKVSPDPYGHLCMSTRLENGLNHSIRLYKEVAKSFIKKPSRNHKFIMHKNCKRDDNRVNNLQWVTQEEHKAYIKKRWKKIGYTPSVTYSKLTEKQVIKIKKKLKNPKLTKKSIALEFNVSAMQIGRIASGENWSRVKID